MAESSGQPRQPGRSTPVAARWRPDHGRTSAATRRRRRIILAGFILVCLAGLLGAIALMLSYKVGPPIPPVQWVGIGVTKYDEFPPRPGSLKDVQKLQEFFTALSAAKPEEFLPPEIVRDNLTRDALVSTLERKLAGKAGSTVLVYVSLHALTVAEGALQFVGINAGVDAVQGNQDGELIPLADIIDVLNRSPAGHVVLLIDAGRFHPNSRLGVLGMDAIAALTRHVETNPAEKVRILCACSAGQDSWLQADEEKTAAAPAPAPADGTAPAPAIPGPRTLFGTVLEEALRGNCDGWQEGQKKNNRIDWTEFSSYVVAKVDQRANEKFAERQQVLEFGAKDPFDVMVVRDPTQVAPQVAATSGEKAAATAAPAPAPAATAAASTAGAPAAAPATPVASAPPLTLAGLRKELDQQWNVLDLAMRPESSVTGGQQRVSQKWRFLLLRAEEHLAAQLLEQCQSTLQDITRLLASADAAALESGSATLQPATLSAVWWRLGGGPNVAIADADRIRWSNLAKEMITKANSAAAAPPAASPPPAAPGAAPAPAAPPSPLASPEGRSSFARWLWDDVKVNKTTSRDVGALLSQVDQSGWPAGEWPVEFLMLDHLSRRSNRGQTIDLETRWLLAVDRLQNVAADLWHSPQVYARVQPRIAEIQRNLLAAERWLDADPCPTTLAEQWLDPLEGPNGLLTQVELTTKSWTSLIEQRQRARRDWPAFAEYIAVAAENSAQLTKPEDIDAMGKELEIHPTLDEDLVSRLVRQWPIARENANSPSQMLLQLLVKLQRVDELLSGGSGGAELDDQGINLLADGLREHLDAARRAFEDDVRSLRSSTNPAVEDHRKIRHILQSSLLNAADRRLLEEKLLVRPSGVLGGSANSSSETSPPGVWRGFWSICQLQFAGASPQSQGALWTRWRSLGNAVARQSADQLDIRARLGQEINRAWNDLERELGDPSAPPDVVRLTRLLGGLPGHPSLNVEQAQRPFLVALEKERLELLSGFAQAWTGRDYLQPILAKLRGAGVNIANVEQPDWTLPAEIACDQDRRGVLDITTSGDIPSQGLSFVMFHSGDGKATLRQGNTTVRTNVLLPIDQQRATLSVQVDGELVRAETVNLALVGRDGFPYDTRRIQVLPPFDKSGFRIKFVTADKGVDVYQDRGRTGSGARLLLPSHGEAQLKPVLIRPAGDTTRKMSIRCYAGTKDGPQLFTVDLPLPADQSEVVIAPPPVEGAAAAPPAAPPSAAPATPGTDVAAGFVFWLVPDDQNEKGFEYRIDPEFWLPTNFVEIPQPTITGNVVNIPIVTRIPKLNDPNVKVDLLTPKQIAVELTLSPGWDQILISKDRIQLPELELGKTASLEFSINSEKLDRMELPLEMMVSVAGWPHFFRWRVDSAGIQRLTEPDVRVALPRNDVVLLPPETGGFSTTVELQVYGDVLDSGSAYSSPWQVEFTLSGGSGDEWPVLARLVRDIRLTGPTAGIWTIRTAALDFRRELNLQGMSGRVSLEGRLLENNLERASDSVVFAIDKTPPTAGFVNAPRRYEFVKPLEIGVSARDEESRIRRIRLGLDANGDKELSLEEADWTLFSELPTNLTERGLKRKFEFKDLPEKVQKDLLEYRASTVRMILEAENRIETENLKFKQTRQIMDVDLYTVKPIVPVKPAEPPPPTEGTLVLDTQGLLMTVVVDGQEYKATFGNKSFKIPLKVGKYTIEWGGPNVRPQKTNIEIKGGDTISKSLGK